ncbi:MAG: DUF11 domain-containing protein [Patescibacteria group bacterium]
MRFLKCKNGKISKFLFAGAALLLTVSQFLTPGVALADGPRFNDVQGDYQLIRGTNKTRNDSTWQNPVSGNAGDEFSAIVYYHNGVLNTTANDVRIKVNLPSQTTNKSALITASISADNAPTVTDTIVGGQIVGSHGLRVNLDQDADITFVPGSTKWFSDVTYADKPAGPLLFGQDGSELFSTGGLKIGNIAGCWEHIGYVSFRFKTSAKTVTAPKFTIDKFVRNVTVNEANFIKYNDAKPTDILEYKIAFANTGNASASNVYLTDVIPTNTAYVAGSTRLFLGNTATSLPDKITGNDGLNIGTLEAGQSGYLLFRVKIASGVANGEILVNTATLIFNKEKISATARTKVVVTPVTPGQPDTGPGLPETGAGTILLSTLAAAGAIIFLKYNQIRTKMKMLSKTL